MAKVRAVMVYGPKLHPWSLLEMILSCFLIWDFRIFEMAEEGNRRKVWLKERKRESYLKTQMLQSR